MQRVWPGLGAQAASNVAKVRGLKMFCQGSELSEGLDRLVVVVPVAALTCSLVTADVSVRLYNTAPIRGLDRARHMCSAVRVGTLSGPYQPHMPQGLPLLVGSHC